MRNRRHLPHVTTTIHLPASSLGYRYIDVDCNIAELIALFWGKSMVTYFSCEGTDANRSTFTTDHEKNGYPAYLVLRRDKISMAFVKFLLENYPPFRNGESTFLEIEFVDLDHNPKCITLRFPKNHIEEITSMLVGFEG